MSFSTLFFDLDDTLYPQSSGLWQAIKGRMNVYMVERLGIPAAEVPALRERYFQSYGTTLQGLIRHHQVDEMEYLAFVHDLPLEDFIRPDPSLHTVLQALPGCKLIFTNADAAHARRVLATLGLQGFFDDVIDVQAVAPFCKPMPEAFARALEISGETNPARCVMLDDLPRTTRAAREFGMYSILVGGNAAGPQDAHARLADWQSLPALLASLEEQTA